MEYILLIKEQISRVSRWCMLKNYFVKKKFKTNFHIEIASVVMEFITLLRLYNFVDMMQSMNGIVC